MIKVILPETPLSWWTTSNIAKWRYCIGISSIAKKPAGNLTITDWQIIFEISLRQNNSIWRLCPSLNLISDLPKPIPILGTAQYVDFVNGYVIFRLHSSTRQILFTLYNVFLSSRSQVRTISAQDRVSLQKSFTKIVSTLQIKLDVKVLTCTDGVCARADFSAYARNSAADRSIVEMLGLVLDRDGLQKILAEAFTDNVIGQAQLKTKPLITAETQSLTTAATTRTPITIPKAKVSSRSVAIRYDLSASKERNDSTQNLTFPLNELHSLICNTSSVPHLQGELQSYVPATATNKRKRKSSSSCQSSQEKVISDKRRRANIAEDHRGGKYRRPSDQRCNATVAQAGSVKPTGKRLQSRSSPDYTSSDSGIFMDDDTTATTQTTTLVATNPGNSSSNSLTKASYGQISHNYAELIDLREAYHRGTTPPPANFINPKVLINAQGVIDHIKESSEQSQQQSIHNLLFGPCIPRTTEPEIVPDPALTISSSKLSFKLLSPASRERPKKYEKPIKTTNLKEIDLDDYTDSEDLIVNADTPAIEMLTDSEHEAEHKSRKLARRRRKQERRETFKQA